jgi:transposase-like protein
MKRHDSDFRSRRRYTPQQRAELLAQYRHGGLSQREFVQRHGLGLSTLTKWLREARQTGVKTSRRKGSDLFEAVTLSPQFGTASWAAEVALAGGVVLRLSAQANAAWATELLQALHRPC